MCYICSITYNITEMSKSTSIYINTKDWEYSQAEFPDMSPGEIYKILIDKHRSVPDITESITESGITESIPQSITEERVLEIIGEEMSKNNTDGKVDSLEIKLLNSQVSDLKSALSNVKGDVRVIKNELGFN